MADRREIAASLRTLAASLVPNPNPKGRKKLVTKEYAQKWVSENDRRNKSHSKGLAKASPHQRKRLMAEMSRKPLHQLRRLQAQAIKDVREAYKNNDREMMGDLQAFEHILTDAVLEKEFGGKRKRSSMDVTAMKHTPIIEGLTIGQLLATASEMDIKDHMSYEHMIWQAFDAELKPRMAEARAVIKSKMQAMARDLEKRSK